MTTKERQVNQRGLSSARSSAAGGRRGITVLGSTGSVGESTIDLLERDPDAYRIVALTAHSNWEKLANQAKRLRPEMVALADGSCYADLKAALSGTGIAVAAGEDAVCEAAQRPSDWVMAAIVGAAGLKPTLTAVERGAVVALANKECLVSAGDIFMAAISRHGATLLPVDSEHNAIFQVFDFDQRDKIAKVILTASGGPFRTWALEDMSRATPSQAVAHPTWSMGAKISVDSATMMNKGLEVIEAHHLFALEDGRIEIVIHPQSVIHSMVEYHDGSVLAQLGTPDMRTPIAFALGWPHRLQTPCARLNFAEIAELTFQAPDVERFPAIRLARAALRDGGAAPTILNAANEVAVARFLAGEIGFLDIAAIVEHTLDRMPQTGLKTLDDILAIDGEARRVASAKGLSAAAE